MPRSRLPHRRPCLTQTLDIDGQSATATVGFDPDTGQPRELFLSAGKAGSALDMILADAATVISIALQHDIAPADLAKSIGRLPERPAKLGPIDSTAPTLPASLIGAALDLLRGIGRN